MTDPEGTAQDLSAAAAPAAPRTPATAETPATAQIPATAQTPATAQIPVTDHEPASGPGPAATAPRRRRRWAVILIAAVVVLGLAAGLVVWAPWIPPPVLRPTGLVAGPATANSVSFHWSPPRTGPLPDKYLIIGTGAAGGSVAGTVTSYRRAGLTPATTYQYRVVAVRGGKRSPKSALLTVRTLTPPLSQARLRGSWQVYGKNIVRTPGGRNGYMTWQFSPTCATGACDVIVHVKDRHFSFSMKLARTGAAYTGHTVANLGSCGPRGNSIPDPETMNVKIRVTKAAGQNQEWAATSFAGTMAGTSQYVSSATIYCTASRLKASLAGTPA